LGKARESYLAVTMFCAVNCLGIADICNLLKDDVINENNWNGINKKKAHTFRFIIELMLSLSEKKNRVVNDLMNPWICICFVIVYCSKWSLLINLGKWSYVRAIRTSNLPHWPF